MNEIELWKTEPIYESSKPKDKKNNKFIFPSARQAISHVLKLKKLGRKNRVAIPEWSSNCVINAIGKYCMPIPFNEIITYNIPVDAILIYEQWGWPVDYSKILELAKKNNTIVICDRVDSCDIDTKAYDYKAYGVELIEIFSLFKLIGAYGGGLVRIDGKYLENNIKTYHNKISEIIWNHPDSNFFYHQLLDIHKNKLDCLHPKLITWIENNDFFEIIYKEEKIRKKNLSYFIQSKLTKNWPKWMNEAYENGAAPGIIPLFRNRSHEVINTYKKYFYKNFNIKSEFYHFNFSNNPYSSKYQNSLAFPINNKIENLEIIINKIEDLGTSLNHVSTI